MEHCQLVLLNHTEGPVVFVRDMISVPFSSIYIVFHYIYIGHRKIPSQK